MKNVLRFFSHPEAEPSDIASRYEFREPTLSSPREQSPLNSPPPQPKSASAMQDNSSNAEAAEQIPTDYAGIVQYFHNKVAERKSPYNALVTTAERLKEFIPDETSRLKAVLAICKDQWPHDALPLAISTHISDIEMARQKAKANTHNLAGERAENLRKQARQLKEQNSKMEEELHTLDTRIGELRDTLDTNRTKIAALNEKIQIAEADANASSFVDQAAENLKNDLLAKKVILGLS